MRDDTRALLGRVGARCLTPAQIAQRELDRLAVRAILDTISTNIDAAQTQKTAAQAILDATAPTNVAQAWVQTKALARAVRETDDALIGVARGVKDLARFVKDL